MTTPQEIKENLEKSIRAKLEAEMQTTLHAYKKRITELEGNLVAGLTSTQIEEIIASVEKRSDDQTAKIVTTVAETLKDTLPTRKEIRTEQPQDSHIKANNEFQVINQSIQREMTDIDIDTRPKIYVPDFSGNGDVRINEFIEKVLLSQQLYRLTDIQTVAVLRSHLTGPAFEFVRQLPDKDRNSKERLCENLLERYKYKDRMGVNIQLDNLKYNPKNGKIENFLDEYEHLAELANLDEEQKVIKLYNMFPPIISEKLFVMEPKTFQEARTKLVKLATKYSKELIEDNTLNHIRTEQRQSSEMQKQIDSLTARLNNMITSEQNTRLTLQAMENQRNFSRNNRSGDRNRQRSYSRSPRRDSRSDSRSRSHYRGYSPRYSPNRRHERPRTPSYDRYRERSRSPSRNNHSSRNDYHYRSPSQSRSRSNSGARGTSRYPNQRRSRSNSRDSFYESRPSSPYYRQDRQDNSNNRGNYNPHNNNRQTTNNLICWFCQQEGHIMSECPARASNLN
jgi:hypothetical protein